MNPRSAASSTALHNKERAVATWAQGKSAGAVEVEEEGVWVAAGSRSVMMLALVATVVGVVVV